MLFILLSYRNWNKKQLHREVFLSDLDLMNVDAKYSIPRINMGVLLEKNNMELFKERFGELPK